MSDWITLTPSRISEALTAQQSETLSARPNQGTALDPLSVAIDDATNRVRAAIRGNGLNRLSANPHKIPPELKETATTLALLRLAELWPLFYLDNSIVPSTTQAQDTLLAVKEGQLPLTLPTDPEPVEPVRRSTGVRTLQHRSHPIRSSQLRGL